MTGIHHGPVRTPRLHQLAGLALARISAGHDPLEAILAALIAATDAGAVLPDCFDRLSAQQREVALVMWGAGAVHARGIARALDLRLDVVLQRLQRMAMSGFARWVSDGTYGLQRGPASVAVAQRGSHEINGALLAWVRGLGGCRVSEAARHFGVEQRTMGYRLRRLVQRGHLTHPRRGWFAPVDHDTSSATRIA